MARNRHNVGFMAIDRIAHDHGFGPWRQRFRGVVAEGQLGGERIIALKPLTYMNNSGESVQPAAAFYKLPTDAITVFYDELDLAPGRVRVKRAGGAAGHNGLRSMDKMLGTQDYWRVRIGIGHPGDKSQVLNYVLGRPQAEEERQIFEAIQAAIDVVPTLLTEGSPKAMNRLHTRNVPPTPDPPPRGAGST